MRVVHVYKDIYPVIGGIENHVRLLCRELARDRQLDVRILVTNPSRGSTVGTLDGVPVIRAGRLCTVASTPISPRLALELRRMRPDIVHLHVPYPIGELAAMLAAPSVPTVITYHSDVVRQKALLRAYAPLLRRVLARAARILATSPAYLASSPWLQPVRDRCAVVPLGIDLAPFSAVRREREGATLLFVGRFRYYKGLTYLLRAMAELPEARLVLVGGGPAEGALRDEIAALGIADRVRLVTDAGDAALPALYAAADLFVLPACERSEAFGLVLVEAAAIGLPAISTDLGTGTSYVNQNGVTGLVVPPADARALAAACRLLLADSPLRQRMGQAAQARAAELFAIGRVARQVAEVYREVAAERRRV